MVKETTSAWGEIKIVILSVVLRDFMLCFLFLLIPTHGQLAATLDSISCFIRTVVVIEIESALMVLYLGLPYRCGYLIGARSLMPEHRYR